MKHIQFTLDKQVTTADIALYPKISVSRGLIFGERKTGRQKHAFMLQIIFLVYRNKVSTFSRLTHCNLHLNELLNFCPTYTHLSYV